jgi:hypothetical protein
MLATLLVFSGCLTLEFDVTVNQNRGGTVSGTIWMPEDTYASISSMMGEDLFEAVMADPTEYSLYTDATYSTYESGGSVYLDFSFNVPLFDDADGMIVSLTGNILRFEDRSFSEMQDDSGDYTDFSLYNINYKVTLPSNIIDSNADTVSGRTAEWEFQTMTPGVIYATCDITAQSPASGWLLLIAGMVFAAVLVLRYRK